MGPTSTRLHTKSNDAARQERLKQRDLDNAIRGQPHRCQAQRCTKSAVHRGSLCAVHKEETEIDKNLMPLIYQGCPQFIPRNQNRIKWAPLRHTIADWIQFNLDCPCDSNRLKSRYPEIVLVRGWKGSDGGLYEPKQLNGMLSLPCLTDVAGTRTLFAAHYINLPAGNVTPEQVRQAINEWVSKTFEREWRVIASGLLEDSVSHESTDPFEPDENDPDDPLRSLPPLSPPQFIRGLCAAPSCSYLAFMHPYCAACCKQKYQLEVKRTMRQDQSGLGLFATARLTGCEPHVGGESLEMQKVLQGEYFINFCTVSEIINKQICASPVQYNSP